MIQTIPNCINSNDLNNESNLEHLEQIKMQLVAIVLDLLTLLPEELGNCSNLTK
jgi:hypothetical protein